MVQGLRESGGIGDVIKGALPFVFGMLALIGLLMIAPDVALWLPNSVMGKGT